MENLSPFEQAILAILPEFRRNQSTALSRAAVSAVPVPGAVPHDSALCKAGRSVPHNHTSYTPLTEEKIAKLYLNAVAGAAAPDSPFTVHYPASNHAQLIVRQSGNQSEWSAKEIFSAECIRIVQRLRQTTDFLAFLLDDGYADAVPREKNDLPGVPNGIGTEWRCYRSLPKDLICDLCFFRQVSVVIRPSAFDIA
ncbi:hypothetical protein [Treponema brennaborense]|uniref:Uncharacterized protein n=1 Tax=Treponema brennaborense (strain DSM 12168 / CIP 105900 / DD5/3) TaxID=906968 RepID=F4LIE5_TREBD|nr:hypothetical protein [Treponema brennaborense]AEE16186.1 hypothetical protein Trebr_0749 [Treponema brennaborense DSM 12168]